MNPIQLSIFASKISSICDEMGAVLRRSAFSPNIRDRLDYSCAIFSAEGELCAQAAHIPVHLGSMAYAMSNLVSGFDWADGDTLVVNDPYLGGTHVPDVTLISPVFVNTELAAFVANRAHHADIGGDTPGSMPISSSLEQEGLLLSPRFLARGGEMVESCWAEILAELGAESDTRGDFLAQMSANKKGVSRLIALLETMGVALFDSGLSQLNNYGEQLARSRFETIPDGIYSAKDYMDDDGQGRQKIPLCLRLSISGSSVELDFEGTHEQVNGNINCPISVVAAAAYYVFRCLLPDYTPACAGVFRPIQIKAPLGSLVNAQRPAAVAAGNVETSSRLVDLVISALRSAIPEAMPADSQGTMNNIALGASAAGQAGAVDRDGAVEPWGYYETIGGGMGAHSQGAGISGVQTHMTNTLNTPVEVLESSFPLRIREYSLRANSGGSGRHRGGDGLVRDYEFLAPTQVTLLTERRLLQPSGANGGADAQSGRNLLNGRPLPPKIELKLKAGDRLRIETPGGGGYGSPN